MVEEIVLEKYPGNLEEKKKERREHRLINAEAALSLAIHRMIIHLQEEEEEGGNPAGREGNVLQLQRYLIKLENILEEHVSYCVRSPLLSSQPPLLIPSEILRVKRLLDAIKDHHLEEEPSARAGSSRRRSRGILPAELFHNFIRHLKDVYDCLRTLSPRADRTEDVLEAFKMSMDALERAAGEPAGRKKTKPHNSIVYGAALADPEAVGRKCSSWSVKDAVHQGFLWKREDGGSDNEGGVETRYWALLFPDALLLTHVNHGVHFVEERPLLLHNIAHLHHTPAGQHNNANPSSFRLVNRRSASTTTTGSRAVLTGFCGGHDVVTLRAEDSARKDVWIQFLQHQMDDLKSWRRARSRKGEDDSSCSSGGAASSSCWSTSGGRSGIFPVPVNIASSQGDATSARDASYRSYSGEDLYLVTDQSAGPVIRLIPSSTSSGGTMGDDMMEHLKQTSLLPSQNSHPQHDDVAGRTTRVGGSHGGGVVVPHPPSSTAATTLPEASAVPDLQPNASVCSFLRGCWTRTSRAFSQSTLLPRRRIPGRGKLRTTELASVTICLKEADQAEPDPRRPPSTSVGTGAACQQSFQSVLDTITEDDSSSDVNRMRQFHPSMSSTTDERHVLHSTGDSTETSPSWASASSSAMETPNEVDHSGLAFDFSRKCELNPTTELRRQQQRAALSKGHQQKAASYSMPTTPEMTSETSPSPRQTTSGIFRFPFAGHGSPRRFRSRTLSAEGSSAAEDSGSTAAVVRSSPAMDRTQEPSGASVSSTSSSAQSTKLRFPRFLRRTHSASSTTETPPYALFLRSKRAVSKTRSADMTGSPGVGGGPNDVFDSVDDAMVASGGVACRKTRLSDMRLRLGFLRRRSTESSLSARPSPEEAQKWSESFVVLMASKYGAALYRAFLLREFSNENLEFWMAVEDYKSSKPQKMSAKAQKIYNDFVAVQAPKEVNLDSETRMITLNNVQSNNPDQHAFDRAQRRIQHMMERDSYVRFLQSELFLELIHPERYPSTQSSVSAELLDKSAP